jgi:hypothetical protein
MCKLHEDGFQGTGENPFESLLSNGPFRQNNTQKAHLSSFSSEIKCVISSQKFLFQFSYIILPFLVFFSSPK